MASSKGSKGKKRCTKGKSCGASCIQMRKVCWKEMGDGVSSSASKVRDMIQPNGKEQPKKPGLKVPKGVSILQSSPGDEKFLPRLQYGWKGGTKEEYDAWIKKHKDEVRRVQGHLNEIRAKEKESGRKYSDKKIREMLDVRGMIEARERDIKNPKTNQKYLAGLEADKKKKIGRKIEKPRGRVRLSKLLSKPDGNN